MVSRSVEDKSPSKHLIPNFKLALLYVDSFRGGCHWILPTVDQVFGVLRSAPCVHHLQIEIVCFLQGRFRPQLVAPLD